MDLDKQYNSKEVETKWYSLWESKGYFRPQSDRPTHHAPRTTEKNVAHGPCPVSRPYVIVIPPPNVTGILHKFLDGLASLRSPLNILMVFVTSVIIWLFETLKYWFVMQAFGFSVSFFALMLMNGIVNLATTIPSAPGYIGTFDAPGIAVLGAYGVDQATAAGYTLTLHAALWIPITLLGAYYLAKEGIRWSDTLRTEAQN